MYAAALTSDESTVEELALGRGAFNKYSKK